MRSDVVNIAKQEQFPNVLKAIHLQAFESVFVKCKCQVTTLPSRKLKIFLFRRENADSTPVLGPIHMMSEIITLPLMQFYL